MPLHGDSGVVIPACKSWDKLKDPKFENSLVYAVGQLGLQKEILPQNK